MRRSSAPRLLIALALLATATAGCVGTNAPDESIGTASTTLDRSLESQPNLQVGEWWTVESTWAVDGRTEETTLVVSERTNDTAYVGMAADAFSHRLLVSHLPILGDLPLDTLAWNLHGSDFEPVHFPLERGQTWTTELFGIEVDAEVTSVDGQRAQVRAVGQNVLVNLTYDARVGMVTSFQAEGIGSFEVTDHGYGYEGKVKTPSEIDMDVIAGRAAGVVDAVSFPGAAAPVESTALDRDVSHVTVGYILGDFSQPQEALKEVPGVYRFTATAPDGTEFAHRVTTAPGSPQVVAGGDGHDAATGSWRLDFQAAGTGVSIVELIGYNLTETTVDGGSGPVEGGSR